MIFCETLDVSTNEETRRLVGSRLKAARRAVPGEITQEMLDDLIGVPHGRTWTYENGKALAPDGFLKAAAKHLGTTFDRLRYGDEPEQPVLGPPMYPVGFPTVRMPYAGVVPAGDWGDPLDTEDFIEVEVKFERKGRFATRVVGDSCYPALKQGDIAIWESDPSPAYGLIVLAERKGDHGVTVKELDYDPVAGRPTLEPINDRHDAPPDGDGWSASARLVGLIRNIDGVEQTWYLPVGLRKRHLV